MPAGTLDPVTGQLVPSPSPSATPLPVPSAVKAVTGAVTEPLLISPASAQRQRGGVPDGQPGVLVVVAAVAVAGTGVLHLDQLRRRRTR